MRTEQHEHLPVKLWWVLAGLTLVWGFNWTALKVAITDIAPSSAGCRDSLMA